jgi:aldose 1-epimerase
MSGRRSPLFAQTRHRGVITCALTTTLIALSDLAGNEEAISPPPRMNLEPGALIQPAPSVLFRAAQWSAEFAPQTGGHLLRLRHLPSDRDILHFPATPNAFRFQPERHGIPVLFPPNRIDSGRFTWRGQSYTFPINDARFDHHIHGIVLQAPWETTCSTADQLPEHADAAITLTFRHDESRATFPGYPHRFSLRLTYTFYPNFVRQDVRLKNLDEPGAAPMPFGLGFHTAFRLPVADREPPVLRVTAAEHYWEINPERRLPTGELLPWSDDERYHTPAGQPIDSSRAINRHFPAATSVIDGAPFRGAILDLPADLLRVTYEIGDDFGHWYLWRPPDDRGVLCVEPMSWAANAPNLPLPEKATGLRHLDPGAQWETWTRITVTPLPITAHSGH